MILSVVINIFLQENNTIKFKTLVGEVSISAYTTCHIYQYLHVPIPLVWAPIHVLILVSTQH